MSRSARLTLANFVCRFGDKQVLLDQFDEVIVPAFFNSPPRTYGKTTYHLFDLQLTNLNEDREEEPAIIGRFVQDSEITRSHTLASDTLVANPASMESATSARFALILSSHTLIYIAETSYAPSLSKFRATMMMHILNAWKSRTDQMAREIKASMSGGQKISMKDARASARQELPLPTLEILELPSSARIKDFLSQFDTIAAVKYRLIDPNHTSDFSQLIQQLRKAKEETGSANLELVEKKPTDKEALARQLEDATADGNVEADITGKTKDGGRLSGSNEQFSYSYELVDLPQNLGRGARNAYTHLRELIRTGVVRISDAVGNKRRKFEDITRRARTNDYNG